MSRNSDTRQLDYPIAALQPSSRARKACEQIGVCTIAHFVLTPKCSFLAVAGCGEKTYRELEDKVRAWLWQHLGDEDPQLDLTRPLTPLVEGQSFEQAVSREAKLKEDKDFQQTVKMYQQLKAKQVKQIFQQLLAQGMTGQVVEYLAAMQIRKAAAVIREFKSPNEVVQAANLLQSLRERGLDFSTEDLGNVDQAQQSLAVPNSGDTS